MVHNCCDCLGMAIELLRNGINCTIDVSHRNGVNGCEWLDSWDRCAICPFCWIKKPQNWENNQQKHQLSWSNWFEKINDELLPSRCSYWLLLYLHEWMSRVGEGWTIEYVMSSIAVKTTHNSSRNLIRRRHFKELVDWILLLARFKGSSLYRNYNVNS